METLTGRICVHPHLSQGGLIAAVVKDQAVGKTKGRSL